MPNATPQATEPPSDVVSPAKLVEAELSSDSETKPGLLLEKNGADEPGMVPVTEAIRYRKRAQGAEQELKAVREERDGLKQLLLESREAVTALERRQRIDALLSEADAVDLEAARLLTEVAVSTMDEPDVESAIQDLRQHKPYLFRRLARGPVMSARLDDDGSAMPHHAGQRAAETGDRRDLLAYLRLRRKP